MEDSFIPNQIPISFQRLKEKHVYSDSDLDNHIKRVIMEWSKTHYACPATIFSYLYQSIQPQNMKNMIDKTHVWKKYTKLHHDIDANVRVMLNQRAAVTFYDVNDMAIKLQSDYNIYTGPLKLFPVVKEMILSNSTRFNPSQDTVNIRFEDVIVECSEFLKKQILQSRMPVKESIVNTLSEVQFFQFLKNKFRKTDALEFGLKITNFVALRDAVYKYQAESYVKEITSKKLTKLLRAEISNAMANIITKLKSTKIFPNDSDVTEGIKKFATLPFEEAIKKLFQPFLDEQNDILETNAMNKEGLIENGPMSVIHNIYNVLTKHKVYGKLFHLATIVGAIHETKNGNVKLKNEISLEDTITVEERNKVFLELICHIGTFLKLYLAHKIEINEPHPLVDKLEAVMNRICEICNDIVLNYDETNVNIKEYKRECLSELRECCKSIIECYKDRLSLENIETVAKLQLGLLTKTHTICIMIMSRCKIEQDRPKPAPIRRAVVDIVFKYVINEMYSPKDEANLTPEVLLVIKNRMLEIMELSEWPLKESFNNYVTTNSSFIPIETPSIETDNHSGTCLCIAIDPQYLVNKVHRLPQSVCIDNYTDELLSTQHGLLDSINTKRLVKETWTDHWKNISDVMEDGLTAVVDVQSLSILNSKRQQVIVCDCEEIMQIISQVPLLEEVCHATKWNELYRHHWGDMLQFVQDNVLLATKYNVRIVETQLGRLRINAFVDEITVTTSSLALQSSEIASFTSISRQIIGQFVSLSVKMCLSSPIHNLLVKLTSEALTTQNNMFGTFVEIAMSIVSSEFATDVFIHLLCPIALGIFNSNAYAELQKSLSVCSQATISLLKQYNPNHLALQAVKTHIKKTKPIEVKKSQFNPVSPIVNCSIEDEPIISEDFEITVNEDIKEYISTTLSQETNRQLVEDIRRKEFGVGLKDDGLVAKFNRREARQVDLLSSDLYANPTHFVIELIQNADDNRYPTGTRARLSMSWQCKNGEMTLRVTNNECGFTTSDLRSLCDVGASTKCSMRTDKIGRKGIGFKSVFIVSDSPEVHSNGFHIRFNRYTKDENQQKVSCNPLIPEWIGENGMLFNALETTIVLPIVSALSNTIRESVATQLHPSLLLFLRRLKHISIASGPSIEIVDEECKNNKKVVVTEKGEKHIWFMHTRPLIITDPSLQAISPGGMTCTNISVAIPFNDNQESKDMAAFAFLPIRSYGLRFIINADFTIPASREDIANNCPWNKWLIDQASTTFIESIKLFLSTTANITAVDIAKFVDSVPLPGEVPNDSTFTTIVPKLRSGLSQLSWLPNQDDDLYPPTQLIIDSNDDSLLTNMLCERLHMSFLHSSINDTCNDRRISVLKWLGCQQLSLAHLASLLVTVTEQEITDTDLVKSIIVAIHTCLHRENNTASINRILTLLRATKLWPVVSTDNSTISLDNSLVPVFLPSNHYTETSERFYRLRQVISPVFLASFVSDSNKQVNPAVTILKRLGVYELSNKSMIELSILPRLSQSTPSRQWLIEASQFLAENCTSRQYKESVLPKMLFATVTHTANGIFQTITPSSEMTKVHLPLSLDSNSVVSLLKDRISYIVVDQAYQQESVTSAQWISYFHMVGVSRTFSTSIVENNQTSYPELTQLLSLDNPFVNIELLRYLDFNWSILNQSTDISGLLTSLTTLRWIPVSTCANDLFKSDSEITLSRSLHLSSEVVYITSNDPNKQMISDSLLVYFPYCPIMFQNEMLPSRLGMSSQVTSEHVLTFLKSVMIDKSVSMNKQQSSDIYQWIYRNLSKESVCSMFASLKTHLNNEMLLILPSGDDKTDLIPPVNCYWSLPNDHVFTHSTQVYDDLAQVYTQEGENCSSQRPLVNLFPNLKELFVNVLGVKDYPAISTIGPILQSTLLLLTHDRLKELNSAEIDLIADVYNIIHFLENYHRTNALDQSSRDHINRMNLIPCLSGRYRSYNNTNKDICVYSWRNMAKVIAFQELIANESETNIDFLSLNCFIKRETSFQTDSRNQRRLSASQFLFYYFDLPVLEDNISYTVMNRELFESCAETKSMFDHLEIIVSQWLEKNVSREALGHFKTMLASVVNFYRGDENIELRHSLFHKTEIMYETTQKVYIGPINGSDSFEMYIGGLNIENDGIEMLGCIMNAVAEWILDGDSQTYFRSNFRNFYKSLLDLIESSDRNQVSIFIRSHQLRIQPYSIDYIYNMFARSDESILASFTEETKEDCVGSPNSVVSDGSRKRCKVTVESGIAEKKCRLDTDQEKPLSRPVTPIENNRRLSRLTPVGNVKRQSRPGTPRLDQISLKNMESAYLSGRIGEQLANEKLKSSRRLGEWDLIKIDWINENTETMLPYDFKLRAKRQNSEVLETIYLEVKATTQADKRQFNMSAQEVSAAWSNKAQFHLLLVFHSGMMSDQNVKFAHIPDVLGQLQDNNCKLLIDIDSILDH